MKKSFLAMAMVMVAACGALSWAASAQPVEVVAVHQPQATVASLAPVGDLVVVQTAEHQVRAVDYALQAPAPLGRPQASRLQLVDVALVSGSAGAWPAMYRPPGSAAWRP